MKQNHAPTIDANSHYAEARAYWSQFNTAEYAPAGLVPDFVRGPALSELIQEASAAVSADFSSFPERTPSGPSNAYIATLTAAVVYFARHSEARKVVVCSPAPIGRPRHGIPLFFDMDEIANYAAAFRYVAAVVDESYRYCDLPWNAMLDELGLAADEAAALFKTAAFERCFHQEPDAASLETTIEVISDGASIRCIWRSEPTLLQTATVDAALKQVLLVIEHGLCEPERALDGCFRDWAGEGIADDADTADDTRPAALHVSFSALAAMRADEVAMVCGGRRYTYGGLEAAANNVAAALRGARLGLAEPVGLLLHDAGWSAAATLGAWKAGGVCVPIGTRCPASRLRSLLDHVGAKWLLTDDEVVGSAVTSGRRALQLQSLPESGPVPDSAAGPWTPAQLAFASEAVGAPRAAVIAHETRSSGIVDVNRRLSIGTDDCVLEIVAPGVATHGHELLGPLIAGARLVRLAAGPADCDAWHELVRREHVTVLHAAPDVVERMLDQIESWPSPSSMALPLRLVLLGGPSTPSTALLRRCRQVWSNAVVASLAVRVETGGAATLHVADETTAQRGRWPRGRALAGRRARVLDEHGRLNRPLIPGNLFFGPGGIASAYCGHAAETARVFVPDPQSAVPGARLFATGERAWYLAGGDLEVLSASDSRPVVHGVQVDLDALERMLGRLPGIADAAIVVRDAGASEEQPHCVDAYVVLDVNCTLDAQRLTQELAGQLPDFLVPRRVIAVPRLARCANGRLDPIAVPSGDSRGCTAPDALREVTRVVGSLFAQLLNVETVESDDDFFLLGGYSLLAIELVARIKEVFGVTLPLVDVFEFPTVQQLAGRIDAELGKAGVDPQRIVDVCATVDAADRKNERAPVDVMRRSGMAPV